jgi:UDP-glucose 4-epimerase
MNILLTGGAGYIGSHSAVVLSEAGHKVVLIDNFCNSHKAILAQLEKILGKCLDCIEGDIRDTKLLIKSLQDFKIDAVIHFAGLKSVSDSVENPLEYFANNVQGTISLLDAMKTTNRKILIFSSSATVYGDPQYLPIDENHPTNPKNPYGRTKLQIEEMLLDLCRSDPELSICALRYFNPVGAHCSGLIGESPNAIPSNLMPYIDQVALGNLSHLNIYGNNYSTLDGTGVRDYIHVVDLAQGHLSALSYAVTKTGMDFFNLGTGRGYSVLEVVNKYRSITGALIPFEIVAGRKGDVGSCYASVDRASSVLRWSAKRTIEEMILSAFTYISTNKNL